jgi:XTP/dITP diphosphohydrolase
MPKLLLATNNPGKIREIQSLLDGTGVELILPEEISLDLHVPEEGKTYSENAARKALAFAHNSGLVALGDDSGLEVDTLEGKPGILSHRFAPWLGASDADRRTYLLMQLQGKPRPWKARFRAAVAIATPDGEVRHAAGICEGEIIPEERGTNGFGYDPIFLIPELGKTMAELSMDEKNQLSHRARAIQNARQILEEMLGDAIT